MVSEGDRSPGPGGPPLSEAPEGLLAVAGPAAARAQALIARAAPDADAVLALLVAHQVPPATVAELVAARFRELATADAWQRAVEASRRKVSRLARARELAESTLGPLRDAVAMPWSAIGTAWSRDVDVLVARPALADVERALREAGFLELNGLLERLGRGDPHVRRYAAVDDGELLGGVDPTVVLHDGGPWADDAVSRAIPGGPGRLAALAPADQLRRRAAKAAAERRPTLRAVLELQALLFSHPDLELSGVAAAAAHRCARLEADLGGPGPLTGAVAGLSPRPNRWWLGARVAGARVRVARRLVRRNVVVSFSGIDGSGKSTQAALLVESLRRGGVPSEQVWARLGFSGSRLLSAGARLGQRLLPAGSHSAQPRRAAGVAGERDRTPLTRRGPLGWSWALGVTADYVRRPRRALRHARGEVVVFDRGTPDALVDLEEGFAGELDLSLQRRLVQRLAVPADLIVHLRLTPAAAIERKQDLFAEQVLERYAARLEEVLGGFSPVLTLEASRPASEITLAVLRTLCERIPPSK
jgi:hypothetical protein